MFARKSWSCNRLRQVRSVSSATPGFTLLGVTCGFRLFTSHGACRRDGWPAGNTRCWCARPKARVEGALGRGCPGRDSFGNRISFVLEREAMSLGSGLSHQKTGAMPLAGVPDPLDPGSDLRICLRSRARHDRISRSSRRGTRLGQSSSTNLRACRNSPAAIRAT